MLCSALFFQHSLALSNGLKIALLRAFGASIGQGVLIKPKVQIKFPWKLSIGHHVWIGEGVWIDNLAEVTIQDHVCISQGAYLLTGNHNYKKISFDLITKPVILEKGCWIGAQTTVCPGVTVHENAILTVGSIATKDLQANSICQGNPAVKIRSRT